MVDVQKTVLLKFYDWRMEDEVYDFVKPLKFLRGLKMAHFNPTIFITMSIPILDQISIQIRMELVELKLEFNNFQRLSPHDITMCWDPTQLLQR